MSSSKYQVIYSKSKSKFGDVFEFMGHYPQCDFIYQNVLYNIDVKSRVDTVTDHLLKSR